MRETTVKGTTVRLGVTMFLVVAHLAAVLLAGSVVVRAGVWAQDASRVTLRIDGMTCSSCAAAVTVKLKRLAGVLEARVSFDEKLARVVYSPQEVTPRQMIEAVEELGYKASVQEERQEQ